MYCAKMMEEADRQAAYSTCLRRPTGVGCVIASTSKRRWSNLEELFQYPVATGFTTSLDDTPTCKELGQCLIIGDDPGCHRTVHAEQAAVTNLYREYDEASASRELVAYCTLSPCISCYKLLVSVGIKHIFVKEMYRKQDHLLLCCYVKVELVP